LAITNPESLNLTVVRDEFDVDMFDENHDNEHHVEENDEFACSESDEQNMQPSVGNEANVPSSVFTLCDVSTSSHID
jgi:hypothetical protein